jgi:putative phage-type endonuclease
MEQRTEEWLVARLGKVTASRVADVIARTKSGYSTSRDNYMAQLICERLTNTKSESYSNASMEWGTNTEPLARAHYEMSTGVLVNEVGLIDHPSIQMSGASPDGLIGDDGLLEIKCPNTATHFETILSESIPSKYITQMQWQMACTERKWCDFVSFDPRAPEGLQYFSKRVYRDQEMITALENEVIKFLGEMEEKIKSLKDKAK